MKKALKATLALSLVAVLLIAGSLSAFAASEEKIVIEFPHWFFSHGDAFAEWIVPAIEAYEAMNPNITVNGYAVAYDEYWDKLDTAIASNSAPDVMALSNTNLSKYIDAGVILPFNDYINMEDTLANTASSLQGNIVNLAPDGKTYLLISDIGYYLPMYRPSVFAKAGIESYPTTPEEFYDAMGKLAAIGVIPYACMTTPGNYVEGAIDLSIWIIGLGGHYGVDGVPTLNSEYVKEAFQNIKKLYDAGYIVKDTDKGTYRKMFATGNVGTIIDGQFMYTMLHGWDSTIEGDYAVADLPFPTQHAAAFYEGLAISATSKHPQETADLIAYLCGFEQQQRILDITGIGSARTDVLADKAFAASIYEKWPWMEAYGNHLEETVLNNPNGITGNDLPEIQKILYTALEQVLYENADIDAVLNAAQDEALALVE
jgi:ABC-type glycerol-3-phosphate transport system substrate-binding protein